MSDQASRLRAIAGVRAEPVSVGVQTIPAEREEVVVTQPPLTPEPPRITVNLAKAIAIASGKGGVGKSNIAANIASTLGNAGRRIALFDADMGCANADLLCGLNPQATLEEVILGTKRLSEVMLKGPGGFRLIPGASGVAHLASLNDAQRQALLRQLDALQQIVDLMLIDLGAGIGPDAVEFATAADTVLVVCTPEPTAITDAYGAIKAIATRSRESDIRLIVNMAGSQQEGRSVHQRIDSVARKHLGREIRLAGIVPFDFAVRTAVKRRRLLIQDAPKSRAMGAIRTIARSLDDLLPDIETTTRPGGFLQRLLRPRSGL